MAGHLRQGCSLHASITPMETVAALQDNNLMTPTMELRRLQLLQKYEHKVGLGRPSGAAQQQEGWAATIWGSWLASGRAPESS